MKKTCISIIMAISILILLSSTTLTAFPRHTLIPYGEAWVHWAGATTPTWISTKTIDNDLMLMKNWTWTDYPFSNRINMTFTVTNLPPTGPNTNIFKVCLHFVEEGVSNAKFQALRAFYPKHGQQTLHTWVPTLSEVDMKGWPRFANWETIDEGESIHTGEALNFTVEFGNKYGQVNEEDEYAFTVTSTKESPTGTTFELQDIILAFDTTPPTVVNITITPLPDANNVTTGQLLPFCGRHRFNVTFSAKDKWGLWKWEMAIYNTTAGILIPSTSLNPNPRSGFYDPNPPKLETAPDKNVTHTESWINYENGSYTVKIKVWDQVGNVKVEAKSFEYRHPPKPVTATPTSGYAAPQTLIVDTATGLVKSYPMVCNSKIIGTLVTMAGYSFGPAITTVSVRVNIPSYNDYFIRYGTYDVLVNQTQTKIDGTFTATFVFPKAPRGVYNVTATSDYMMCATSFEVLPWVTACNETGQEKDVFALSENLCLIAGGLPPGIDTTIYVIPDNMSASPINAVATCSASTDLDGLLPITLAWETPLTEGDYDIWIDADQNGMYDETVDMYENLMLDIHAFAVVPEFQTLKIMALFLALSTLVTVLAKRKTHRKSRLDSETLSPFLYDAINKNQCCIKKS